MSIKRKIVRLAKLGPIAAINILFQRILWILWGNIFSFFEKLGLHVLPVHFYSPVPDTRELRRNLQQWNKDWDFTGIDFKDNQQIKFLQYLDNFKTEYDTLPEYNTVREIGLGEGYGVVESHILYGMIRHLKPRQIVEVGSGISTYYSVTALRRNKNDDNIDSKMTCIEPYPKEPLSNLSEDSTVELIPELLQDVGFEFFKILKEDDILFIDSSHIAKVNSDVYHLYLQILPNLNSGVVIHIHDIPFPHLSPDDVEHWIFKKHQFWNESAILKAFLSFNNAFEILLCSSYLHYRKPDNLRSVFNIYDEETHFPSSIWLRKIQ